jgi:hypothetical protein
VLCFAIDPPITAFPYETDPDDHCESPIEAYRDIVVFLQILSKKSASIDCRIYDPYYCNGAVKANLQELGYPNVYNEKEDCYQVWQDASRLPAFDVIITNPPYSGNHIERLLDFCISSNRPWCLLLPNWVHKKDYYIDKTRQIKPFYLVPRRRYVYLPPAGFRVAQKSDVHKKSSPFVSMWYVWGGSLSQNEDWIRGFYASEAATATCELARSKSALRDLRRKAG